ncbi:NF-kappa-B inhibitor zeta isoform X2 [Ambystoma mexicanum]|uniref:NF-kappa-B inhibitor zeta isoform X2 n=1 Tax=Ambystoma mexicanum TaxID=8296 RepID=UPI0037E9A3F6
MISPFKKNKVAPRPTLPQIRRAPLAASVPGTSLQVFYPLAAIGLLVLAVLVAWFEEKHCFNHASGGGNRQNATFQGVRVRNSVKELLMHKRNSKRVSSGCDGHEIEGSFSREQYKELKTMFSDKRSYGYSFDGPVCKRPATFQTPLVLTPPATPNSVDMEELLKNDNQNMVLQNIINIKHEIPSVSLNTVQINWTDSPSNKPTVSEIKCQDMRVEEFRDCQVFQASSPQAMEQSQLCNVPNFPTHEVPFLQYSLPDCHQLDHHQQGWNWPGQSFGMFLNKIDDSSDMSVPVQLQPKANAQSQKLNPNNTVGSHHKLLNSCSVLPQSPNVVGNQSAATRQSKSFFQWQLDQEDSKMANITHEQLIARDADGDTFLHIAVAQGRRALSYVLAQKMAATNELDIKEHNKQSALQVAVAANQHLIVQDLLVLGAQLNTTDCWGRTPLHVCAEKGYSLVLQVIQKAIIGNHLYLDAEATNYEGLTALHCAVISHNAAIHGLSKNQPSHTPEDQDRLMKSKSLLETVRCLIQMGASVNARDRKSGRSALHFAAEEANLELLRLFLDLPNSLSFVNAKSYTGNTALHVVAGLQCRLTQLDAVRLLMRKGADPSSRNLENEQPVHLVADGPIGEQMRRILKGKVIQPKASFLI